MYEERLRKPFITKTHMDNILIFQIYIDDIIFGATTELMCREFVNYCRENLR